MGMTTVDTAAVSVIVVVTMVSLPWCCHHGAVTMASLPWRRHHGIVSMAPSPCCCHHSAITMVLSPWCCYHGVVTTVMGHHGAVTLMVLSPCCRHHGAVIMRVMSDDVWSSDGSESSAAAAAAPLWPVDAVCAPHQLGVCRSVAVRPAHGTRWHGVLSRLVRRMCRGVRCHRAVGMAGD